MSIVKMHNRKTGVTYVYESESYWDREKKQPRNRRTLIGKLDPETGEIVPTGRPGRPASAPKADTVAGPGVRRGSDATERRVRDLEAENESLRAENINLKVELSRKKEALDRIRSALEAEGRCRRRSLPATAVRSSATATG